VARLEAPGVTADNDSVLCTNALGGTLQVIAREADAAVSGSGAQIAGFKSIAIESGTSAASVVAYVATLTGTGVSSANNLGLWSRSGTTTHLLLRNGMAMTVDGSPKTLKSFDVLGKVKGAEGQGFCLSNGVMSAQLKFADGSQAVAAIHADGSAAEVVAAKSDAAPGYGAGVFFNTFKTPGQNSDGRAVFLSSVTGAVDSGSNTAIYGVASGTGGLPVQIVTRGSDAGLGGGATFRTFYGAASNVGDAVAFIARAYGPVLSASADTGVWLKSGTVATLIAREGDAATGTGGALFRGFRSVALPDNGRPLFAAQLRPGTGSPVTTHSNDDTLWAVNSFGGVRLVVREGVTTVSGKTVKKFTALSAVNGSAGQTRSHNADGGVVYRAIFTDGVQGVVRVQVP
jgi:hypothetical protein